MITQPTARAVTSTIILNSWKEIAQYLNRGVRTVQRWEAELGMPVHRPRGTIHSAVFALPHEIDDWLKSRPVRKGKSKTSSSSPWTTVARLKALVQESNRLSGHVENSRAQFLTAMEKLRTTVRSMANTEQPNQLAPPCVDAFSSSAHSGLEFTHSKRDTTRAASM